MPTSTLPAGSSGGANLAQSPITSVLAEIKADGGARTDGDFSALAMLLIDSVLNGDNDSLAILQTWLREERAHISDGNPDDNRDVLRGRLLGLIDASHWAIRRALPLAEVAALERGTHAYYFLKDLVVQPGLANGELAGRLGVDDTEISRTGKKLLSNGLVVRRSFGRRNRWEITPKGRRTLQVLDGFDEKKDAAWAEPTTELSPEPVQRAVGGTIVTLLNEGKVKFDQLRKEVADVANVGVDLADQTLQQLARTKFLTAGARKMMWLNEQRASAVGVRVTSSEVVGLVTGPIGNELTAPVRRQLPSTEINSVVGSVAALVEDIVRQTNHVPEPVVGLGVELAGHIDGRKGSVVFSPDLNWRNVPLRELLEHATGLPTVVENDVNALAVHEQMFGRGRDVSDFAAIFVGDHGVGSGLVVGGTLAHGSEGIAGEIGHLVIDPDGEKCRCGNRGCLETMVSVDAISRSLAESAGDTPRNPLRMLDQPEYQQLVCDTFSRAGAALGLGLAHLLNLLNPARVIVFAPTMLTVEKHHSAHIFMQSVRDSADKYSFSFAAQHYDLQFEPFDETSGPKGAASAVISRLVGRRMRLMGAGRRVGPGRLQPEDGTQELAQRLITTG